MLSEQDTSPVLSRIADESYGPVLDIFGSTVEILSRPSADDNSLCVIRGVIPPGLTIPMHGHGDAEYFYILAGTQQVLTQGADGPAWIDACAGDYVQLPPGAMHALRNVSASPAVSLILTTAKLGRFFEEVGRPLSDTPYRPTPQDVQHFVATCAKYGYVVGTPEENAAAGIQVHNIAAE